MSITGFYEHDWRPVPQSGDWTLPAAVAAHFGLVVEPGQLARITDFCEYCDLFLAKVYGPDGQRIFGLTSNAYIHSLDLFDR